MAFAHDSAVQELFFASKTQPLQGGNGVGLIKQMAIDQAFAPGAFKVHLKTLVHCFAICQITTQPLLLALKCLQVRHTLAALDVNIVPVDAVLNQRFVNVKEFANQDRPQRQRIIFVNNVRRQIAKYSEKLARKRMRAAENNRLEICQISERIHLLFDDFA